MNEADNKQNSANSPVKKAVEAGDKFVKWMIGIAILLFIGVGVYSFFNKSNTGEFAHIAPEDRRVHEIGGTWFLQPQQRDLSLNLATLHTIVEIKFVDSVYCNINISGAAGDVTLSRTYKIEDNQLLLEEPTTGHVVKYLLDEISDNGQRFSLSYDGLLTFKVFSVDSRISGIMNSENSLQKNEFLYPTLTPGERANGTTQVHEIDGRLITIEDPNRARIEKIDVYKMF